MADGLVHCVEKGGGYPTTIYKNMLITIYIKSKTSNKWFLINFSKTLHKMCPWCNILIFLYVYSILLNTGVVFSEITYLQHLYICPWCKGYRRSKWTQRHEFKSWTGLIAFPIALIPLGKVWIQLFFLQLWVNSRVDCVLQFWWGN